MGLYYIKEITVKKLSVTSPSASKMRCQNEQHKDCDYQQASDYRYGRIRMETIHRYHDIYQSERGRHPRCREFDS